MPKPLTGPARLQLLLPWLNGAYDEHVYGPGDGPEDFATRTDYAGIRNVLDAFVQAFDGCAEAAHVVAEPDGAAATLDDEAIGDLEVLLRLLLEQGFGNPTLQGDMMSVPIGALRIMLRGTGRQSPKLGKFDVTEGGSPLRRGLVKRLRDYRAPGAYVLGVRGPMRDLMPFLLAHLLTAPSMASVKRCERQGCAHFVITATAKPGRPQRFCSAACREWSKELKQQKTRRMR